MIAYLVTDGTGRTETVRYAGQRHLNQIAGEYGLDRIVYYPLDTMQYVVYCAQGSSVILVVCVKGPAGTPDTDFLQQVFAWVLTPGRRDAYAYVPMREDVVKPEPNSGSSRTPQDIGAWCDALLDALTAHHVRKNFLRTTT